MFDLLKKLAILAAVLFILPWMFLALVAGIAALSVFLQTR